MPTPPGRGGYQNPQITTGDIQYQSPSGDTTKLSIGAPGTVLTAGVSGVPEWDVAPGFANPMTTPGDIIINNLQATPVRLPVGVNGQSMTVVNGLPSWIRVVPAGGASNQVLKKNTNADYDTSWQQDGGMLNPMFGAGDLIYGGGSTSNVAVGATVTTNIWVPGGSLQSCFVSPPDTGSVELHGNGTVNVDLGTPKSVSSVEIVIAWGDNSGPYWQYSTDGTNYTTFDVINAPITARWWRVVISWINGSPDTGYSRFALYGPVGAPVRLPIGTAGQALTVIGGIPTWTSPGLTPANIMTTVGDIIYEATGPTPARLPIGTNNQVLTVSGGMPTWQPDQIAGILTTAGDILYESSAATPTRLPIGTAGTRLTVGAGGIPSWNAPWILNHTGPRVGNYTLSVPDAGAIVYFSDTNPQLATIPTGIFPVGTYIDVLQVGTGSVTINPGPSITLLAAGPLVLNGQWSTAHLYQQATDQWVVTITSAGAPGAGGGGMDYLFDFPGPAYIVATDAVRPRTSGTTSGAIATAVGAPTSPAAYDILKNGTSIGTITIAAGQTQGNISFAVAYTTADVFQARCTTPGGGSGVTVQLRGS